MLFSEKLLWFGLQSCLYCGSLDRGSDGLCEICTEDLRSWQEPNGGLFHQEIHKLKVETLYQWIPGQQEVLSKLVYALKGEKGKKLWRHYAEEFLHCRTSDLAKKKSYLLVPAPSRSQKPDHAYYFVKALIEAGVGFEIYPCLSRVSGAKDQKKRTRSQRERMSLQWSENITQKSFNSQAHGKQVIFVDDIVTTGSTARAAWRAMGRPRDFAVWALAQRGLSCGASKDLV